MVVYEAQKRLIVVVLQAAISREQSIFVMTIHEASIRQIRGGTPYREVFRLDNLATW